MFWIQYRPLKATSAEAIQRQWKLRANLNTDFMHQLSDNEYRGYTIAVTGERINYVIIDRKNRIKEAARAFGSDRWPEEEQVRKKSEEIRIIIEFYE